MIKKKQITMKRKFEVIAIKGYSTTSLKGTIISASIPSLAARKIFSKLYRLAKKPKTFPVIKIKLVDVTNKEKTKTFMYSVKKKDKPKSEAERQVQTKDGKIIRIVNTYTPVVKSIKTF
jgi:hypothetical protein